MGSRHDRINVVRTGDVTLLDLGEMEIWDGADLSLIRDTFTALFENDEVEAVLVEMSSVKYIPSGFFGMLCDWSERGIPVEVTEPQPNVREMLWFRRFFREVGENRYRLETVLDEVTPEDRFHAEDVEEQYSNLVVEHEPLVRTNRDE